MRNGETCGDFVEAGKSRAHMRTVNEDPVPADLETIRAVAFREGDRWIVQGIEYDIVTHASSIDEVANAFVRAIVERVWIARHLGKTPIEGLRRAPDRFERLFEQAMYEARPEAFAPPPDLDGAGVAIRLSGRAA